VGSLSLFLSGLLLSGLFLSRLFLSVLALAVPYAFGHTLLLVGVDRSGGATPALGVKLRSDPYFTADRLAM
jgi:hypothetical protein